MAVTFGDKIRELRKSKKYSLDKMAEMTKSSKSYLWELEQNRIPHPSATKLQAIAAALDITTAYLLDVEQKEPAEDTVDKAFYRKYRKLPPETKKKMRELVSVWSKG